MANPQNPEQNPQQEEPCDEHEPEKPTEPETPPKEPRCDPLDPGPKPPTLTEPDKCEPRCHCPAEPPANETCLDKLITAQGKEANKAKRAEEFKKELEELLKKATAAKQSYTREKYEDFKKRWVKQDGEIVCAIEHVICKVKCWWCLIECEICPLIYKIREIERKLEGDGTLIAEAHSLYDIKYWHERNYDAKTRRFNRIKDVLTAWYDPAKSIDTALVGNDKLIKSVTTIEPADAVLQLFFKLIPMHLAIAPRDTQTKIDSKYIELCATDCDKGDPDDCCGPDVGVLTARHRMIDPQPYIIDPDRYFDILCCLAEERYLPAKEQMTQAESDLLAAQADIESHKAELERRKKSVAEDFKNRIAIPIDCEKYKKKDGDDGCGCDGKEKPTSEITVR